MIAFNTFLVFCCVSAMEKSMKKSVTLKILNTPSLTRHYLNQPQKNLKFWLNAKLKQNVKRTNHLIQVDRQTSLQDKVAAALEQLCRQIVMAP